MATITTSKGKIVLPDFEQRNYGFDLRAVEGGNIVEGHAAVFDQQVDIGGYFYEIIARGAFDGCDMDDVLFSVNHDLMRIPMARSRRNNGNSTMQLNVDGTGLAMRATLDIENNVDAKALYSSISRKDITGMSIIFAVRAQKWDNLDTDHPIRTITSIKKLKEVTAASFPAYPGTDIQARDQSALENALRVLENARSSSGVETPKNELELLKLKIAIMAKGW